MKSGDTIQQSVHENADAYRKKRARRKSTALKICAVVAPVAVLAVAAGMLFGGTFGVNGPFYNIRARNLMAGIPADSAQGTLSDDRFVTAAANFSVELFKHGAMADENSLLSPLSVLLALAMTENGAAGDTLQQMETAVGRGISADDMNAYLHSFVQGLSSTSAARLRIANSIWLRDDPSLMVSQDFLQTNADFYDAAAYKADFNADSTVNDINHWVSSNTAGRIKKAVDSIDPLTMLYLLNAVTFDARWETQYKSDQVYPGTFHALNNNRSASFMRSEENGYIQTDDATGFIKPYKGGQYAFVALLPNEGVNINDYVQSLTGGKFLAMMNGASADSVYAVMPRFSNTYAVHLNDALGAMGMPAAFDGDLADFSRLGTSDIGNLYIGDVFHQAYIAVDENGTRAGAATAVEMLAKAGFGGRYNVILDRPFVYAIVDTNTNLPLFMGTVTSVG